MSLLDQAIAFATEAHAGMFRKVEHSPYILHPMEAACIVGTMTNNEEVLAAAMLHDVVEDAGISLAEVEQHFGKRVRLLVYTETEDKHPERPEAETWQERKESTLEILRNTKDIYVKMLWMGDKLANMRSFYRTWLREGDAMWNYFNQKDPKMQEWYYRTISELLSDLKDYPVWQEYNRLVDIVFANQKQRG